MTSIYDFNNVNYLFSESEIKPCFSENLRQELSYKMLI